MQLKNLFIGLALSGMLGAGVLTGVAMNSSKQEIEEVQAEGATFSAGTIIYLDPESFDPNNNWTGGYLGAWCWYKTHGDGSSDMWEEFSYDSLSGKYYFTLSHSTTGFTMARYGGDSRQGNTSWGANVWNSGDFDFVAGKNYLYATGWFTGQWQTLTYHVAGTFSSPTWQGTGSAYKMTDGFDDESHHQASFILTTTKANEEFKCTANYNGTVPGDNWYGTLASGYDTTHIGTNEGNIVLKTAGTYEIYLKSDRTIWAQISSADEADTYAQTFLSSITCNGSSVTSALNVWNKVGEATTSMEYKFEHLTTGAKNVLRGATPNESGTNVEKAVAKYDYILKKYGYGTGEGQYHDFMGRTPTRNSRIVPLVNSEDGSMIMVVVTIAAVSLITVGGYFFLRHKKEN